MEKGKKRRSYANLKVRTVVLMHYLYYNYHYLRRSRRSFCHYNHDRHHHHQPTQTYKHLAFFCAGLRHRKDGHFRPARTANWLHLPDVVSGHVRAVSEATGYRISTKAGSVSQDNC